MEPIAITLIDDSDNYRTIIKKLLEPNGYTVVDSYRHHCFLPRLGGDPDIAVLSFRASMEETLTSIIRIHSIYPNAKIVILASVYDTISIDQINIMGVDGFLYKAGDDAEEILKMLKLVQTGQKYFQYFKPE